MSETILWGRMADQCKFERCIGIQLSNSPMCLAQAEETAQDHALQFINDGSVINLSGVPISRELLQRILATAPHDKDHRTLLNSPTFDNATFTEATFKKVTFQGTPGCRGDLQRRDRVQRPEFRRRRLRFPC